MQRLEELGNDGAEHNYFWEFELNLMKQFPWVRWLAVTACAAMLLPTQAQQSCPFDDGNSSLAVEGVILTRYALGITGAPLVMSTGINAVDAPMVEAAINCPGCGLNITGNATLTAADATIISRKLAGFSGDALTNGLALGSGTRNTPAAVQSFLLAGCGATGGTVTSIVAGTGLTGGTISTSGTIAADTTYLQRRVSLGCIPGSAIRAIDAAGNVTCGAVGSGTVTQVLTGAGLTGGPISTGGTINLASTQLLPTTACATDQSPKWNGSAWACTTPAAALPNCLTGQVLRFAASGSLQCSNLPNLVATHVDGSTSYNAIAVGADGRPAVTYRHALPAPGSTLYSARVLKCGDPACTSGNAVSVVDDMASTATNLSIAIPADNLPVVSYRGVGNIGLRVAKCGNASCSSGVVRTTVDLSAGAGSSIAVAIPSSGRPVISYADDSSQLVKVVRCGNAACTSGNTIRNVDTVAVIGTSIATGNDGFPVIAYYDSGNVRLMVAKCDDANCFSSSTFAVDDSPGVVVGMYPSITVPPDGRPLISYYDSTNDRLKVARCGNPACNSGNVRTTVDASANVGAFTSIAMGADGLPVVSYRDLTNQALKFVRCGNVACSSGNQITTVDAGNGTSVGNNSSVAVPDDGLPVISHRDQSNNTIKIVKCSNAACVYP